MIDFSLKEKNSKTKQTVLQGFNNNATTEEFHMCILKSRSAICMNIQNQTSCLILTQTPVMQQVLYHIDGMTT